MEAGAAAAIVTFMRAHPDAAEVQKTVAGVMFFAMVRAPALLP